LALDGFDCQCYDSGTIVVTMTSTTAQEERRGWWRAFRSWPRTFRWLTYAVVLLVLVLVAALVVGVVLVRKPYPQVDGEARLPGLEADVTVVRDEHGIAQLHGDSMADLMRAQGYVHAQERFYEMDVRRHATAGRLAELFGEPALESDRFVRTMDWRGVAEQELALVKPETRAALEQYAEGVNAYLADRAPSDIAVQYTILNAGGLGYRPEPWTAVDSLSWLKAMAWDLRGNMDEEIGRALSLASVGPDRTADLYPAYDYAAHLPIVTQGAVVDGVFEPDATDDGTREPKRVAWGDVAGPLSRLRSRLDAMPTLLGRGDGIGSNSWVVDGEHSATGAPILANDPHLDLGIPGIWVQMGLHCRSVTQECPLDVAGFTFSGVPGVIIGHNADIAWGFTNLGPDVTDLYVERVRGDEWFRDGAWRPLETREEKIEVAGGADETIEVRRTDHGPLLSDVSEDLEEVADDAALAQPADRRSLGAEEDYALALQWTALQPGRTADAILDLNLAGDWDEFREAVASFEAPSQNLVYADREGHIGYQAPGRIPVRKSGNDGRMPAAGWLPENDWTGDYVPYDGLPRVLDPEEGFIVTANQAVVDEDYPYFLTSDWDHGFRSQRIRTRLAVQDEWSVDDVAALQLDDRHPLAAVLTPYLLDIGIKRQYYRDGQDLLRDWDLEQEAGSGAAAYFNVVWKNLLEATFRDELPEDLWPDGGDRWVAVVTQLLGEPDNGWWDDLGTDGVVEDRDEILRRVLLDARDELTARVGPDADDWTWGFLHQLDLQEPTLGDSGIGPVEWLFNRGDWEVGGGTAAVDAASWDASADDPYVVTSGPSMRMVVSLADLDDSRWVSVTGVSGHPFSEHYTDQTDLWARGETLPWPFSRDAVAAAEEHSLTLEPGDP
jgi:penicillin amidase